MSEKSGVIKSIGAFADKGKRRTMEDCHSVVDPFVGCGTAAAFIGLFDGHGGKSASEWCRDNLAATVAKHAAGAIPSDGAMASAFREADGAMLAAGVQYPGCTATVCIAASSGTIRVANVGDTHAVLCAEGGAVRTRLTGDHRCGNKAEEAAVVARGGFITSERVNGMLAVTRTLGDHAMKTFLSCEPSCASAALRGDGSQVLIVACDGLWDHVPEEEASKVVFEVPDCTAAARELASRAFKGGSTDNISVIVARI